MLQKKKKKKSSNGDLGMKLFVLYEPDLEQEKE